MANIFKIDLQEDEWVDQVFEGRNKVYGAYQLRKQYARTAMIGGGLAILFLAVVLGAPVLMNSINFHSNDKIIAQVNTLKPPPPLENKPPPPPPPKTPPPPPVRQQIKFTPPVVKKDEEVKKEDIPPPVEETKKVDIGAKDVKGDPDAKIDIPDDAPKAAEAGEDPNKVFVSVENEPAYPGGVEALMGDLAKYLNNHYPPMAKENNIQGRVTVQFVVEKDGSVSGVTVLRGQELGGGLAETAIAAVKRLKKFTPGRQNGNAVRVFYTVPVTFRLEGSE